MVNYKEILRLSSEGTSQRQIAVSVGHSRDTVSEFLAAAKVHNLSWPSSPRNVTLLSVCTLSRTTSTSTANLPSAESR